MTEITQWRPRIGSATALPGRAVHVVWDDGSEHDIDLGPLLHRTASLRGLDDDAVFAAVTVGETGGSLRWAGGLDITAGTLRRMALDQDSACIRAWRTAHGLSQEAAGDALGLKRRLIQCFEAGSHPIPKTVRLAMIGYDTVMRGRRAVGFPSSATS